MIAVIQRSKNASVSVDGSTIGKIDHGLVILLGVFQEDGEPDADFLAAKIAGLRIFNDEFGKMNLSVKDVSGSALVISQFTLCGDWRKGRRPSFINAASPAKGEALYHYFIGCLKRKDLPVATGEFGAMMDVSLVNDGPVTFVLDSKGM
ncbi:MAG: D-aminoacyl-tRNA deacylase [Candidatus Marinimicrobia bacterium]|nr:D-tyrosyl-tRNA(Tyr) deacylase [bacterium]MCG2716684.1 D-aminoacyl-tRNA deacylase [Candidatus Neomarinimicrobiota bacterium]